MVNGGSPGFHALSFRMGRDGQLTPTTPSAAANGTSQGAAAANGTRQTPGEAAAAAVAAETASAANGIPARTVNHPRPPALVTIILTVMLSWDFILEISLTTIKFV
jgi:hypothetical protein